MPARSQPSEIEPFGRQALRTWLKLLTCTNLIQQQVRGRLRREFNVTLPQFDVLAVLYRSGKAQTMTALSRSLMVSNGNVTGVVDRLVGLGLVERWSSTNDRRVQLIALSEPGRRAFQAMAQVHQQWLAEMLGELSGKELEQIAALLTRTRQSLSNHLVEQPQS